MHLYHGLKRAQKQHSTADDLTCTALSVETYLLQELKLWEEKCLGSANYFLLVLLLFPDFFVLHHHNRGIGKSGEKILTFTTPGISGFITLHSLCQIARPVQRTLINLKHSQLPVNYRLLQEMLLQSLQFLCSCR